MKRSLFFSAVLHLALLLVLIFWFRKYSQKIPRQATQFEVSIGSKKGTGGEESSGQGRTQKKVVKKKTPQLKDLKLGITPSGPTNEGKSSLGEKGGSTGSESSQGQDGFHTANSMGIKKESELYPFFKAVWNKIDAATTYPADFVKQRITGSVDVQLVVNRQGVFTGKFVKANSDESILKAYVMITLVHALKDRLPEKLWSDRDEMIIVTHFDFRVFSVGEKLDSIDPVHFKNILYFSRFSYVDPKLKEEIEKIFTRYLPPIIPIPGGAYIDFYRAYQLIKNYGKIDEDSMRNHRMESMKEQLEKFINDMERGAQQDHDSRN